MGEKTAAEGPSNTQTRKDYRLKGSGRNNLHQSGILKAERSERGKSRKIISMQAKQWQSKLTGVQSGDVL